MPGITSQQVRYGIVCVNVAVCVYGPAPASTFVPNAARARNPNSDGRSQPPQPPAGLEPTTTESGCCDEASVSGSSMMFRPGSRFASPVSTNLCVGAASGVPFTDWIPA